MEKKPTRNVRFIGDNEAKNPMLKGKPERKQKSHRKLIFLVGFKNTGKDTVCKLLEEISPDPVVRVAFADALKSECYPVLGKEYNPDNDDREWKDDHRKEIIEYGESKKMQHGMYYWVKRALDDILVKKYDRRVDYPHIVVTDCRRIEEIMWFKHFKLGHFDELKEAREIYEPIILAVHREGAEEDNDYLTHVAVEYAGETRVLHGLVRNYKGLKELKKMVEDLYLKFIK